MKNIQLNVLPFQETLNAGMCGAASVKIVLAYYGMEKSEAELAKLLHIDPDLGTDDISLKRVAESLGFSVEIQNEATFEDIAKWLEKGVPPIVDWFTVGRAESDSAVPDGHYSVVTGLDDECIFLQDPEIGRIRKLARDDFLSVWFDFRGLVIRPDELVIRQTIAIFPKEKFEREKEV